MENHFIRRLYQALALEHFQKNRQMLFLMGPRQVGKTTIAITLHETLAGNFQYFNWDNLDDRALILEGPSALAKKIGLETPMDAPPFVVFDEIHKYREWKTYLKGFFDTYSSRGELQILVTGSARLDVFQVGGDSLMGRYFRYRIHPLTVGELLHSELQEDEVRPPSPLDEEKFQTLLEYGGFPEPFSKKDPVFDEQWRQLRHQQLFQEDIRELSKVYEIGQMELLALHVQRQVGSLTSYTSFSKKVRVSLETIRRWLSILSSLYYLFPLHPWSKNISRSLLKEPKFYLWDWSFVEDRGARGENFIASHLQKAVHYWTDRGWGKYELYFLRDKEKCEVDFLVTKNEQPWFLVEVKSGNKSLSPHLAHFQKQTNALHAFQVELDAPFRNIDCFSYKTPVIVPAKTLLSQLI